MTKNISFSLIILSIVKKFRIPLPEFFLICNGLEYMLHVYNNRKIENCNGVKQYTNYESSNKKIQFTIVTKNIKSG